jgi:3-(3-hydroxy-phenyl)propionate hydroxylase
VSLASNLIIVGGGPVGTIAALAAVQAGFDVTLIEESETIDTNPRAATTHPSTLEMIARVGLIEEFIAEGLVAREFQFWDRPNNALVATFDHDLLRDETPFPFVVQTEQHKLVRMGLEKLKSLGVTVRLGCKVLGCAQDSQKVRVDVESQSATESLIADWVLAADGGRSTIRKNLGIEFEGYTWPERFLVLTILDDLQALMGCCFRNYLADAAEWANIFKVAGDDYKGRWRVVVPVRESETDEEALSAEITSARLHRIHALDAYRLVHRNLYRVHQRVAKTFRLGRVLLAGDAAHVNNPIGGLGLNFGIHDAIDAIDSLAAVALHGEDDAALDRYSNRRRSLNIRFVQEQTVANKKRLEETDEKSRSANFDNLRATASDPIRAKEFLLKSSLIASVREAAGM